MPSKGSLGFPDKPQQLALAGPVFRLGDVLLEYPCFHLYISPQYHHTAAKILFFFRTFFPLVLFSLPCILSFQ